MKRTGLIFSIVSIYIIAAFAWWTYSHIKNSRIMHEQQLSMLELLSYKATVEVKDATLRGALPDTSHVQDYIRTKYPSLELIYLPGVAAPPEFLVRPQASAQHFIRKQYKRRILMYTLEGVVMMALLFWGVILIYRSFLSRIRLKRQQSNFLLSVTHELKTPLASIKLYLETLARRRVDLKDEEVILKNSLNDVARLRDLVDNMLLAAQLENEKYVAELTAVNLSELVNETTDKYAAPRNLEVRITRRITPGITIRGDANALVMVLNNLLSNAFKYSPPDAGIEVVLKGGQGKVTLCVSNEGPGIPDDDKKHIFERFYRAGNEEMRNTKGTGLGLFIVKNLLDLHEASVTVKDRLPSGVTFEIIFTANAA